MASKVLQYISCNRIDCGYPLPKDIIVCVPSDIVVQRVCQYELIPFNYIPKAFIEAVITKEEPTDPYDSCSSWKYWISYDDESLIEGSVLTNDLVEGVFCKNCFTKWVEGLVGNPVFIQNVEGGGQVLVNNQGCPFPLNSAYSFQDSYTVDFSVNEQQVTAEVIISEEEGNAIEVYEDGLYVPEIKVSGQENNCIALLEDGLFVLCGENNIFAVDTNSIDLNLASGDLTADLKISGDSGNQLEVRADGAYVPAPPAPYITGFTDTQSIDLDVSTGVLTANARVSSNPGNTLTTLVSGLFVPPPSYPITTVSDTNSIDLNVSGLNLTGSVKVSANAHNNISIQTDGIYAKNFVVPLASFYGTVGNSGSSLTSAFLYTIPANLLTNNGDYLEIFAGGGFAANANLKDIQLAIASTFLTNQALATNSSGWTLTGKIFRNSSTTGKSTLTTYREVNSVIHISNGNPAVNWGVNNNLGISIQGVSNSDLTLEFATVTLYRAP